MGPGQCSPIEGLPGASREGLPLLAGWDPGLGKESLSWLLKGEEKDPKWAYILEQQLNCTCLIQQLYTRKYPKN